MEPYQVGEGKEERKTAVAHIVDEAALGRQNNPAFRSRFKSKETVDQQSGRDVPTEHKRRRTFDRTRGSIMVGRLCDYENFV